jgi:hypothetical protein
MIDPSFFELLWPLNLQLQGERLIPQSSTCIVSKTIVGVFCDTTYFFGGKLHSYAKWNSD